MIPKRFPTLADSRRLRIATPTIFYIAHGLPMGLFYAAIIPRAVEAGMSPENVGKLVAMLSLPWGVKILVAVLMDRYPGAQSGHRRPWIIASNTVITLGLLIGSIVQPGPLDFVTLGMIALAVSAACATLDTAIDGLTVEVLRDDERGTASSLMYSGQALGLAGGTALGSWAIVSSGLSWAFAMFAALSLPFLIFSLVVREGDVGVSQADRLSKNPKSLRILMCAILQSGLTRNSVLLLLASAIGGVIGGIFNALWPLLAIKQFQLDTAYFGQMMAYAMIAGSILAMPVGAALVQRLGAKIAPIAAFAGFAILALFVIAIGNLGQPALIFSALTVGWVLSDLLASICLNPLRLGLSNPAIGATHFTAFTSASNLAKPLGAIAAGTAFQAGMASWALFATLPLVCLIALAISRIYVRRSQFPESTN